MAKAHADGGLAREGVGGLALVAVAARVGDGLDGDELPRLASAPGTPRPRRPRRGAGGWRTERGIGEARRWGTGEAESRAERVGGEEAERATWRVTGRCSPRRYWRRRPPRFTIPASRAAASRPACHPPRGRPRSQRRGARPRRLPRRAPARAASRATRTGPRAPRSRTTWRRAAALDAAIIVAHFVDGRRAARVSALRRASAVRAPRPFRRTTTAACGSSRRASSSRARSPPRRPRASSARSSASPPTPSAMRPLGEWTFPAPGMIGERHIFYFGIEVDPRRARRPDRGRLCARARGGNRASRSRSARRARALPPRRPSATRKTELALRRLVEHVTRGGSCDDGRRERARASASSSSAPRGANGSRKRTTRASSPCSKRATRRVSRMRPGHVDHTETIEEVRQRARRPRGRGRLARPPARLPRRRAAATSSSPSAATGRCSARRTASARRTRCSASTARPRTRSASSAPPGRAACTSRLAAALDGTLERVELTRMRVELNGRDAARSRPQRGALLPRLPGGDLALHPASVVDAAERAARPGSRVLAEEEHKSSGLWVGPAAGSTAAQRSAGGNVLPLDSRKLQYVVREPYRARRRAAQDDAGARRGGEQALDVKSQMRQARVFLDGDHIVHEVTIGDVVTMRRSGEPLVVLGLSRNGEAKPCERPHREPPTRSAIRPALLFAPRQRCLDGRSRG